jgi:hypothetical protein
VAALVLPAAGCGSGKTSDYNDSYNSLNDQLVRLGNRVGTAVVGARSQTNPQLERQFSAFASEMGTIQGKIDDLDPPDHLKSAQAALVKATGNVQNDLENISRAAGRSDPQAAGTATSDLLIDSAKLRTARRKIARETGAKN